MPLDYVLGPGFYQWRGDHLVRLKEEFRKSVVLIGTGSPTKEDEITPWGTAFLVCEQSLGISYLVTAAHVIAKHLDAPFDIRFNVTGAGARIYKEEYPEWVLHPTDNTVDVAVHQIDVPDWADVSHVPMSPNLAEDDRIRKKDIGAGCETYTVGLWKFLHGKKRNQNYVYTGHVGLIPEDEKIPIRSWLPEHKGGQVDVDAYLVEGEPIDGSSGSPVFVRRTLDTSLRKRRGLGKPPLEAHSEGSVWLLGLQSNAFFAKLGEDYEIPSARASGQEIVPRGVNVVIPVEKIIEVLDHPNLKAAREAAKDAAENAKLPLPTGLEPSTTPDNPQHKEDFRSLLNAAAKGQPKD